MIQLTSLEQRALLDHLRDYINLMDQMFPNQEDAVKTKARALLADCSNVYVPPLGGSGYTKECEHV